MRFLRNGRARSSEALVLVVLDRDWFFEVFDFLIALGRVLDMLDGLPLPIFLIGTRSLGVDLKDLNAESELISRGGHEWPVIMFHRN